jgi:hypothetical protein
LPSEIRAHREALRAFIDDSNAVPLEAWNEARAIDKWSPAQVAEHLRLTYTTLLDELEGRGGFRIRTRWWQRWLIRVRYLRSILQEGRFPAGVPATREIRPAAGPYDRQGLHSALIRDGESFIRAVENAPSDSVLTHPFVGQVALLDGMRFATQHIRHHHKQIAPAPSAT